MKQTIVIGLTGGIGGGKSTVARILLAKNIAVYIADDAAKELYLSDPILKEQVIAHFGANSYHDGILNRQYLSKLVFNSKEKLLLLNELVHPAVARDFSLWKKSHSDQKMVIKEAAILFESGSHQTCDFTVTVNCPEATRIHRVMNRDNTSKEAVQARINQQWTDEQRSKEADFTLLNDGNQLLVPQIDLVLSKINAQFSCA
ncbi:MAG: dephospho-CoA kinase [Flavobacteriales bacterium]|jgi:dephospho-CoA kinase